MKRLPIIFITALMLTLAACGSQSASPELQGAWSGQTTSGATTVPLAFEVGPNGQVANGSFNASYNSEYFSFTVDSKATGSTITITATASNSAGDSLVFVLTGEVNGDVLSGQYRLDVRVGTDTSSFSGSFSLARVPA